MNNFTLDKLIEIIHENYFMDDDNNQCIYVEDLLQALKGGE